LTLIIRKPRTRSGPKAESDWRYYEKNRERILKRVSRYRVFNREKIRTSQKQYRIKNADRLKHYFSSPKMRAKGRIYRTRWNAKAKLLVLSKYGVHGRAQCVQCGITDIDVLTIDHMNGGGRKHRESVCAYSSTSALYRWFIRNKFPIGFQTLCANCNLKKEIELRRNRSRVDGGANI